MKVGRLINKSLKKINLQVKKFPDYDMERRLKLLSHYQINKIFDIGANIGDYARFMREAGYKGKIVSFEPQSKEFQILKKAAQKDKNWQAVHMALGSSDEERFINIAGNSQSSSLMEMRPEHSISEPSSAYVGKEKIVVRKTDTIMDDFYEAGDHLLLKIDTQGFEKEVLAGAVQSLNRIAGIQLEMSLIMLYEGETLYADMISFLKEKGFHLYSIENGFSDPKTGRLLQIDGIFFK
jgi:FkbM family methyltransferase